MPSTQSKKYQTQWAAQFHAAAELTRRGYLVALTHGTAVEADLLVVSPGGQQFMIDVKGLSSPNFWLIRERPARADLYYVLVYLPANFDPPISHVASSAEVMARVAEIREKAQSTNANWNPSGSGLNWRDALPFLGRWDILPE
jgi:hypothetical protein